MNLNEILILMATVFFARITDVTIGTIRTIFLVDGRKYIAAMLGFVEVTIWFLVVRNAIVTTVGLPYVVIAYAGGFASGNLLGSFLSAKLMAEKLTVNVVTSNRSLAIVDGLRSHKFGVTKMECTGRNESLRHFLFLEIKATRLDEMTEIIKKLDPGAFITVNRTKVVVNGFIK
jgi:uncharacterized protein YebE (UPF0316 family)